MSTGYEVFKGSAQTQVYPNVSVANLNPSDLGFTPTLKQVNASALNVFTYQVEDLAAGADIADRAIFKVPTGYKAVVKSIEIVPIGSAAGIDDSNTCVVTLKNGASTMASKTFNTATAFPTDGGVGTSLGTISNATCASDARWFFSITNGATANPPMFMLSVSYTLETN